MSNGGEGGERPDRDASGARGAPGAGRAVDSQAPAPVRWGRGVAGLRALRDALLTERQLREEVDEELAFHLDMRARALESEGYPPAAAREEALRQFGDMAEARAVCLESDRRRTRRLRRREWLSETRRDVALALRQLRRRPGFAAVAALTLAVGIGATTAIFSAADHVLLRPLAYAEPERVAVLWERDLSAAEQRREVSPGNFVGWRDRTSSFEVMGLAEPSGYDVTDPLPPEPLEAWAVSEGFLEALGVVPVVGRRFAPEEYRPGSDVVLISTSLWQSRYGSDPGIVGGTIQLDGRAHTVVGVLPTGLSYPEPADIWAPRVFRVSERYDEREDRASAYMMAAARLRPGVTMAQAERDLERAASQMTREYPETNAEVGAWLVPLREQIVGDVRPALLVLLGAVGFVLLIACANVAGLLLARGVGRQRELAVRSALGAGRGRLMRQLGTEAAVLAVVGGALGIGLAWVLVRGLRAFAPAEIPRIADLAVDGRALAFAAVATLATALIFGLAPSLRLSRTDLLSGIREGGRGGMVGPEQQRLRRGLVVAEVALALVLLVGTGLLGRSFAALTSNDLGFRTESRAAIQLFIWDQNQTGRERIDAAERLSARFRALPGVQDVALTTALPFHPSQIAAEDALIIDDRPEPNTGARIYTVLASPGYFRLLGIPLVEGRDFAETDRADAPAVAIVNRSLARRFFPEGDAIGKRITFGVMAAPFSREIVGIVEDVRPTRFDSDPRPEAYVPFAQSGNGSLTFVVRTAGPAAPVLPALRDAVWQQDPLQTVYHTATLDEMVAATLVARRFNLALLGALAAVAVGLAAVGIYGLLSFATSLRTGEIGVRMALGARRQDVLRMVVREGLLLALPGVVLGSVGALLLTRFLGSMLYGVGAADPVTFTALSATMLTIAAGASLVPARRAARADPLVALREE